MRKMLVATALIAGMTLPAIAQTSQSTGNRGSYASSRSDAGASAAYTSRSAKRSATKRYTSRSRNVYSTRGRYIGSDPDPRVRDQLRRDQSQGGNNP